MNLNLPLTGALLLALTACKSTGVDRSEDAAQAMRDLHAALTDAPQKITAVSASLETLSEEGGDMRAEFATFSDDVDVLIDRRNYIRSLNARLEESRTTFAREWERSHANIQNPDIRARAEQRRTEVVSRLDDLSELADAGREQFEPWMQTVLDVRTYLESDLNPAGVDSVRDLVEQISGNAVAVNQTITALVAQLEQLASAIAAAKPPPETTPDR